MTDAGDDRPKVNVQALSLADAARMLTALAGEPVPVNNIEADVADGAPTNADGTINLVHYAAWIAKEMGRGH